MLHHVRDVCCMLNYGCCAAGHFQLGDGIQPAHQQLEHGEGDVDDKSFFGGNRVQPAARVECCIGDRNVWRFQQGDGLQPEHRR